MSESENGDEFCANTSLLLLLGKVDYGDLGPGIEPYGGEGRADSSAHVEAGVIDAVKPLGIGGPQVGEAEIPSRQADLDLPSVVVAGKGERNALGGGIGEDLRAMGKENRRHGRVQPEQGCLEIGVAGTDVIDPGDGE